MMFSYLRRQYYYRKLRRLAHWQEMLNNVNTPEQFILLMYIKMFDDHLFTEHRFLVLECFTLDLCKLRQTNVYYNLFVEFKEKYYQKC